MEKKYRSDVRTMKSKSKERVKSVDKRPDFDNVCFDPKVERKKDRKGGRGDFVTDKITNPNAE